MLHRSLCQQVVIELYYAVAEGEAFDRWSTSVTTRQSSCEHDSALAAPSVLLYGFVDLTHTVRSHLEKKRARVYEDSLSHYMLLGNQ